MNEVPQPCALLRTLTSARAFHVEQSARTRAKRLLRVARTFADVTPGTGGLGVLLRGGPHLKNPSQKSWSWEGIDSASEKS